MMTDPISDMLARIRNAGIARHAEAWCPHSKLKAAIARLLSEEGFLGEVSEEVRDGHRVLVMRAGRIVGELAGEQMTESAVLGAAFAA